MFKSLFNPKSIAIIGASSNVQKIGNVILKNLINEGFTGKIYPVNPHISAIEKLKCYTSVKMINDQIDLAIITLPSNAVPTAVEECVEANVKFIIPIAGGFSETGSAGKKMEEQIKQYLHGHESRVLGPNTVGLYVPRSKLNTALTDFEKTTYPPDGVLGFISQSGALGLITMDTFSEYNVGFSAFINLGNRIDLDELELMQYFLQDDRTKAILLYIETFKNLRAFTRVTKVVTSKKPVIVLKAGRTVQGIKAASLHTGALGGNDAIVAGALKQCGAIRVYTEVELVDFGRVLAYQKPLLGPRLAVLTTAGGVGVITTDYISSAINGIGLEMATLTSKTKQAIKSVIAPFASAENPIDVTAGGGDEEYHTILNLLNQDPNVDGIVVYALFQTRYVTERLISIIRAHMNNNSKPIVVGVLGGAHARTMLRKFEALHIPAYPTIARTVKAMKALYLRGRYLKMRGFV